MFTGHGMVKVKNDIDLIKLKDKYNYFSGFNKPLNVLLQGIEGLITAYLPDEEKFGVYFHGKVWLTFSMSENEQL